MRLFKFIIGYNKFEFWSLRTWFIITEQNVRKSDICLRIMLNYSNPCDIDATPTANRGRIIIIAVRYTLIKPIGGQRTKGWERGVRGKGLHWLRALFIEICFGIRNAFDGEPPSGRSRPLVAVNVLTKCCAH